MKAVVFEKFGQAPTIQTVPDPKPAADGVVIKVEATGLCQIHMKLSSNAPVTSRRTFRSPWVPMLVGLRSCTNSPSSTSSRGVARSSATAVL